ncbi:hypothetical protein [Pedobacter nyackensis]|uniref:hypothetical protein n=1 Tax=Pedobacter nyackensis TaxID=475255 RepID=UPI002930488E|nr:hypothetical protein [Pedobacter nyackensis]
MKTLKILKADPFRKEAAVEGPHFKNEANYMGYLITAILLLLWPVAQHLLIGTDPTIGFIDPNIWLLILLSLICFMVVVGLCWWVLQQFWLSLGLPLLGNMVLQFRELSLWQQLGFYWASFVSLLLAAVGVLTAIL